MPQDRDSLMPLSWVCLERETFEIRGLLVLGICTIATAFQHRGSSMAPKLRYGTEHRGRTVPEGRGLERLSLRKARCIIL